MTDETIDIPVLQRAFHEMLMERPEVRVEQEDIELYRSREGDLLAVLTLQCDIHKATAEASKASHPLRPYEWRRSLQRVAERFSATRASLLSKLQDAIAHLPEERYGLPKLGTLAPIAELMVAARLPISRVESLFRTPSSRTGAAVPVLEGLDPRGFFTGIEGSPYTGPERRTYGERIVEELTEHLRDEHPELTG